MEEPTIYWGIQCTTCLQTIAFGVRGDHSYGFARAFLKPGEFECLRGRSNTYNSDNLHFFKFEEVISDAAIQKNRAGYRLLDQPGDTYPIAGQ
jgi:hypothetical protein